MRKLIIVSIFLCSWWFSTLAQTTLPTFWNFSTPGISTPPNGWITGLGTNGNLTYSGSQNSVGGDNIAARLDATGEFITIWFADKPGELSYWVRGTGISPNPAFTGTFKVQESTDGNNWLDLRTFTNNIPGAMSRFVDVPQSTSRYVRFFYTDKQSGSNVSLDSVLLKDAPAPPTPTMQVKVGSNTLVNNNIWIIGNDSLTILTLENKGTSQALKFDSVVLSGNAASDYQIEAFPDSINAQSAANIALRFNPAAIGSRRAILSIYNNDIDKNPYIISLYGVGGDYATEPSVQPVDLTFSNITAYGFNFRFNAPNGNTPEKYIVLRKIGAPVTETPNDGITYRRGDYIGNAQVVYIGDSAGSFKPTYITANTTYHYAVFAFNGPAGFENYLTTGWLANSVSSTGKNMGLYYNGIDPRANDFINKLTQKINPHDTIFYSLYIARMVNPWLTRDTINGEKTVSCVYTNDAYVYSEPFLWWTGTNSGKLTREHTFAQSWMPSNQGNPDWPNAPGTNRELPEYNDLHHLFPANQPNANARRSNNPFGNVVTPTYTSPTGFGKLGTDANGQVVYEPRPEHKGDVARALFYMCTAYNGINGLNWSLPGNQRLDVLRQWHLQDPPDAHEIARHEFIAAVQKNRNPFIDNPEWANRINFSNMTFIPDTTPVVPVIKILSPVLNETVLTDKSYWVKWTSLYTDTLSLFISIDGQPYSLVKSNILAKSDSTEWQVGSTQSNNVRLFLADQKSLIGDTTAIFKLSSNVGLNQMPTNNFKIYPVPSNNQIFIELDKTEQNFEVNIYNMSGARIIHKHFNNLGTTLYTILTENLENGVYFIELKGENLKEIKKMVINRN